MSGLVSSFFFKISLFFFQGEFPSYAQDQRVADSLEILYKSGQFTDELLILKEITENQIAPEKIIFYADRLIEKAAEDSLGNYLVSGYLQKGNGYKLLGDFKEALEAYFKGIELAHQFGLEERVGAIYKSIEDVFSTSEDSKAVDRYYADGINELRKSNDSLRLAIALLNSGDRYFDSDSLDKAITHSEEANELFTFLNNDIGIGYALGNLGMIFTKQGKYETARQFLNQAIRILSGLEDKYPLTTYNLYLAKIDQAESRPFDAFKHAQISYKLATVNNLKKEKADASKELFELHNRYGNRDSARFYILKYIETSESLRNQKETENIAKLTRDFELVSEQKNLEHLNEKNKNQNTLIIATATALFLIGILAGMLYRSNYFMRKSNLIIQEERNKSDLLLRNILPVETVIELKKHGKVKAQRFDSVSVMFTDFKNFTKHASNLSPEVLVMSLDYYFSFFDQIVEKYKLEKIKTLGDSYMCASGLPFPQEDHAERIVLAAIEMVNFVNVSKKLEDEQLIRFEMRIGISSGPVIAGIVGSKKFAYDIWGDTVNCASRMENNSEPGRINISEDTHRLIEDKFYFSDRGELEVKNKGKMNMYFVEEVKNNDIPTPHLSLSV